MNKQYLTLAGRIREELSDIKQIVDLAISDFDNPVTSAMKSKSTPFGDFQ